MAMSKADRCECFNEWGEGGSVCQGYMFGFTYGWNENEKRESVSWIISQWKCQGRWIGWRLKWSFSFDNVTNKVSRFLTENKS